MDALARVEQLRHLSDQPWPDPWKARQHLLSASAVVRGYAGWWISPVQASTAILSGDGSTVLGLPCTHVLDVVEVRIDGVVVTDYRWAANGVMDRKARWPDELANISVAYVGGWEATPEDVVAVVCGLADLAATPAGVAQQSIEDQSVTYARSSDDAAALTKGMCAILDRGFAVPPRA